MNTALRHLATGMVAGCCWLAAANAAELHLELAPGEVQSLSTEQLLARPDVQTISIPDDVAYKRAMTYRAVPMAALLAGVVPATPVQMVALDGFVAELDSTPLLNSSPGAARAWLAIEEPGEPWPALGPDRPSAGPFYMVWTQPEASGIRPEQWPYQTAEVRITTSLAERFPAMLPAAAADDTVQRGWKAFQTHCVVCHTVNRQGAAAMGPDLNVPHNPTEYFAGDFLRQYIRDPAALRYWPQGTMPPFDANILPDAELDDLLAYLKHMAGRKVAP